MNRKTTPAMILLLFLLLFSGDAGAQEDVIDDFINLHRRGEENVAVKVPGWLVGLAGDIAETSTDDPHERILFSLLGEVGTVHVVTYRDADFTAPEGDVGRLLYTLEHYKGFERWADVRAAGGERINFSVRYHKKKVRDLVVVVKEAERTTLVTARTHLTAEELGRLVTELAK